MKQQLSTVFKQLLSLCVASEMLNSQQIIQTQTQSGHYHSYNGTPSPLNPPNRLVVEGKILYQMNKNKRIEVLYSKFENEINIPLEQSLSPKKFQTIVEEVLKENMLRKIEPTQCVEMDSIKIEKSIEKILKFDSVNKIVIKEAIRFNISSSKFEKSITRHLQYNQYGLTCVKNENETYCLSFVTSSKQSQVHLGSQRLSQKQGINMGDLMQSHRREKPLERENILSHNVMLLSVDQYASEFPYHNLGPINSEYQAQSIKNPSVGNIQNLLLKASDSKFERVDRKQKEITELQSKLKANKLFMNMVIHDLRSPSENIYQGLTQAKQANESRIKKLIKSTQSMVINQIIPKSYAHDTNTNSFKVKSSMQMSRQSFLGRPNNSQAGARRMLSQMNQGSPKPLAGGYRQNRSKVNSDIFRQLSPMVGPKTNRNENMSLAGGNSEPFSNNIHSSSSGFQRGFSNDSSQSQQFQLKNKKRLIFTIQEDNKDSHDPSSNNHNLLSQGIEHSSLKLEQLSQQQDLAQKEEEEEKFNRLNESQEKNIKMKSLAEMSKEEDDEISGSEKVDYLNLDLNNFDQDFDFNEDEMDENGPAKMPQQMNPNDNQGKLKNKPRGQIEFVQQIVYVDRKPFLGMSRSTQTEQIDQEFSQEAQVYRQIVDKYKFKSAKMFVKDMINYEQILRVLKVHPGQSLNVKALKFLEQNNSRDVSLSSGQRNDLIISANESSFPRSLNRQERKRVKTIQNLFFPLQFKGKTQFGENQNQENQNKENKKVISWHSGNGDRQVKHYSNNSQPIDLKDTLKESSNMHYQVGYSSCQKCFKITQFFLNQIEKFEECNQKMDLYVQQSILSAYTLTILINDLLDLAKMENANFKLNIVKFNMFEVIAEAYQILLFQAEQKGIKLLVEFLNTQPFILRNVSGDRRRFLQIFINFVSNSLKFTKKGGFVRIQLAIMQEKAMRQEEIILKSSDKGSDEIIDMRDQLNHVVYDLEKTIKLRIVIEDSGVGIKKENLNKIFKDYSRLDEHQEMNAKGTGLGMSICKKIVEKMEGICKIESEENVGTSVIITVHLQAIDQIVVIKNQANAPLHKIDQLLEKLEAKKLFPEFLQKFENETHIFHNDIQKYSPEVDFKKVNRDQLEIYPELELYKFNPFGINQCRNKNQKVIERLLQNVNSYLESFRSKSQTDLSSRISHAIPVINHSDIISNFDLSMDNSMILDKVFNLKNQQSRSNSRSEKSDQVQLLPVTDHEEEKVAHADIIPGFDQITDPSQMRALLAHRDFDLNEERKFKVSLFNDSQKESPQCQVALNSCNLLQDAMLCKYEDRKLRVLIANDNDFQLMIIYTSFLEIPEIGSIDKAVNGVEALKMVRENESYSSERYYDLIFLDLDMPMLDGFDACKQIKMEYSIKKEKNLSANISMDSVQRSELDPCEYQKCMWLKDLISLYQHLQQQECSVTQQKVFENLRVMYQKVKYRALNKDEYPYIFAYSSLVTGEVIQKAKKAGFLDLKSSPLTVTDTKFIIQTYLDSDANSYIDENFSLRFPDHQKFTHFINQNFYSISQSSSTSRNEIVNIDPDVFSQENINSIIYEENAEDEMSNSLGIAIKLRSQNKDYQSNADSNRYSLQKF